MKNKNIGRVVLVVLLAISLTVVLTACEKMVGKSEKTKRNKPHKSQPGTGAQSGKTQTKVKMPSLESIFDQLEGPPGKWTFKQANPVDGNDNWIAAGPNGTVQIFSREEEIIKAEMTLKVSEDKLVHLHILWLQFTSRFGDGYSDWIDDEEWKSIVLGPPNKPKSKRFDAVKATVVRLNIANQPAVSTILIQSDSSQ